MPIRGKLKTHKKNLVFILPALFVVLVVIFLSVMIIDDKEVPISSVGSEDFNGLDLTFDHTMFLIKPGYEEIVTANAQKSYLDEQARLKAIKEAKLSKMLSLLSKNKSPVASRTYAEQILTLSEQNDADHRIIVAIMGVESGFCKNAFFKNGENTHNCFGYLNGVTYPDFKTAFDNLIPKIAKQYANKYGWDFESLAKAYGQIGWESTSSDMLYFANQL